MGRHSRADDPARHRPSGHTPGPRAEEYDQFEDEYHRFQDDDRFEDGYDAEYDELRADDYLADIEAHLSENDSDINWFDSDDRPTTDFFRNDDGGLRAGPLRADAGPVIPSRPVPPPPMMPPGYSAPPPSRDTDEIPNPQPFRDTDEIRRRPIEMIDSGMAPPPESPAPMPPPPAAPPPPPGRAETSGSFRPARREAGSGFPPPAKSGNDNASRAKRASDSGFFPAAGKDPAESPTYRRPSAEDSGTFRAARASDSGSFRTPRAEDSGEFRAARDSDSGSFRVPRSGDSGSFRTPRPEDSGSFRAERAGDSGSFRVPRATDSGRFRTPRAEDSGRFTVRGAKAEDSGSFRAASKTAGDTGSQRRVRDTGTNRPVTPRASDTGSHRTVERPRAGDSGTHRVMGKAAKRRRVAAWPIACAVLVVLGVLGWFAWGWADDLLNSRAEAQAAGCPDGNSSVRVVVAPAAVAPVTQAAAKWNNANTVVHAHCIHVDVQAMPSDQVLNALTGKSGLDAIGGLPTAWVPETSYWVSQLTTAKPEMVGSAAQSVATARSADYPFLGLSGAGIDDIQKRAVQTFRDYLKQPGQQADFARAGLKAT
jgi:hypothetical protein